ncbi:hypothetical protein CO051_01360 [Candidatus Roizmanbacteria bacterium CG_4_9_14_0_2_um_filter_39_13]|uniref:BrnT family toxin n=2 Tax=Candidatus Roizmaniibacteriota TaxID=1752723 RepID=A0A2M8F2K1_9BACT|nr:MAG: hypothetical protein CO051_01360 [Candidatus Roizmanbacteria bacterium CG_4_9_14_0_2_um_filter_39_13]PJE62212.1 MAG: hypothetical protein COU87_00510 [Candidatus Roizmanbacteria bacterium CG10_big_fil_rev_8_21_14_0_10_39_12]
MKLHVPIAFEWDEGNKDKNWKKHTIHYKEIEEVFFNRSIKIFPDSRHSQKEKRFLAYGRTHSDRLLTIIFTVRNNKIRIISARRQSKKERSIYEK